MPDERYESKSLYVKSVEINKGLQNSLFDPEQEKVESGGGMMDMMKKMMERQ